MRYLCLAVRPSAVDVDRYVVFRWCRNVDVLSSSVGVIWCYVGVRSIRPAVRPVRSLRVRTFPVPDPG